MIELCDGSGVSAEIDAALLPLMAPEVLALIAAGCVPGGSRKNLSHTEPSTHFDDQVSESEKLIFADAQTSGGLLLSVPDENLNAVMETLEETGAPCAVIIGKTTERREKSIYVTTSA